jgi:membrane-associated phospholipid phosphatase
MVLPFSQAFWQAVTWFGDTGFLLPAALWIAVWLGIRDLTRPLAWRWAVLFGLGCSLIVASKIAFLGWGIGIAVLNFTGFSGHTALSASVWPVACWLAASRQAHRFRIAAVSAGVVLAALIGASRLALYAHSKSEVAAGFALGMVVSGIFLRWQHRLPHPRLHWLLVLISLGIPLAFMEPGTPAPAQGALEVIAMHLAGTDRVYTREDLLARRRRPVVGIE